MKKIFSVEQIVGMLNQSVGSSRRTLTRSLRTTHLERALLNAPGKHDVVNGELLYACSSRPHYFGSDQEGPSLVYVVSDVAVDRTLPQISEPTGVDAAFLNNGCVLVTTLGPAVRADTVRWSNLLTALPRVPMTGAVAVLVMSHAC